MGMRWRSEKEVIAGKGQFSCGARGCNESRGLATYEVPFGYEEAGQKKQALVKVGTVPPLACIDLAEMVCKPVCMPCNEN